MDILVTVVLPLSLAFIMFSLGVGLTLADFQRVARFPLAFGVGAACQVLIIPIIAYAIILVFGLTGEIAAGVMLLSFCPGGVTSNIVSRLAKADVALSVSLTAVISLLSIITVPLFIGWAVVHFMGKNAPYVSVSSLAIAMFLITTLPVALGMVLRRFASDWAVRAEPIIVKMASVLFIAIVIAAIAANWNIFIENLGSLGPALISLNIATFLFGLIAAGLAGLSWRARKTIAVEVGIQNGTLGITLAPLIVGQVALPIIGLPSAVYGVTMYLVALPFIFLLRSK